MSQRAGKRRRPEKQPESGSHGRDWHRFVLAPILWFPRRFWPRVIQTYKKWQQHDGSLLAASTTYYAAFSFFPLLLLLTSALGFVLQLSPGAQNAQRELLELLAENTSELLRRHVASALARIRTSAIVSAPLGLLTMLAVAIGLFAQIEAAFDRIWNVPHRGGWGVVATIRRVLFRRFRAFLMLLGVAVAMYAALLAGVALSVVERLATSLPGGGLLWPMARPGANVGLFWLLFTVIYKAIPRADVRWSEAARGALLTALVWEASRQVLTLFLVGENYSAYGVVGSLMALMLWLYFAISVLYVGAEYVHTVWEERKRKSGP
jgi:membrane protein